VQVHVPVAYMYIREGLDFRLGFRFKKLGVQNTLQMDGAFGLQDWTSKLEEWFLKLGVIFLSGHFVEIWWATLTALHFSYLELES
jgi:hypothetical protein